MITSITTTVFPSTIVSDAFEAVTNGMNKPEAIARLEQIKDQHETRDWYHIIKAIDSFYNLDYSAMDNYLEMIPKDSNSRSLCNVLYAMTENQTESGVLSKNEAKLVKQITAGRFFLLDAVSNLNSGIDSSEELFIETVSLLIKEIKRRSSSASARLALWAFEMCIRKNYNEEILADNILMLYGQAEGLRLIALALIEHDPGASLICFCRSLINRLIDKTTELKETSAYLEIIEALVPSCTKEEPIIVDIKELFSMLESELNIFYKIKPAKLKLYPKEWIKSMKRRLAATTPAADYSASKPCIVKESVQLELF